MVGTSGFRLKADSHRGFFAFSVFFCLVVRTDPSFSVDAKSSAASAKIKSGLGIFCVQTRVCIVKRDADWKPIPLCRINLQIQGDLDIFRRNDVERCGRSCTDWVTIIPPFQLPGSAHEIPSCLRHGVIVGTQLLFLFLFCILLISIRWRSKSSKIFILGTLDAVLSVIDLLTDERALASTIGSLLLWPVCFLFLVNGLKRSSILKEGYKRPLEHSDIPHLGPCDRSEAAIARFVAESGNPKGRTRRDQSVR
ncbi:hypothetical protein R1flu_014105 [Riccia fluitans]|uniref:Uncharacterized protein n=1 Tax=Riccia fluitans TaxID=41844 RepID=A0ABD1YF53_9MARC